MRVLRMLCRCLEPSNVVLIWLITSIKYPIMNLRGLLEQYIFYSERLSL